MNKHRWHFVPKHYTTHPFESFAYDDVLMHMVSEDHIRKVRSWVHEDFVILGLQDMRLPNLSEGTKFLEDSGVNYIVRNSGGLGVVLDRGVLNLSIIVHKTESPTIESGYELMYDVIQSILPEVKIEAYEIVGSYCPGNFDLSINGQKFAGISQRRIRDGVSIQIYLAVSGNGGERAMLMKKFYHHSNAEDSEKFKYPRIEPYVMASLSELIGHRFTVEEIEERLMKEFETRFGEMKTLAPLSLEHEQYSKYLANMKKRNERFNIK